MAEDPVNRRYEPSAAIVMSVTSTAAPVPGLRGPPNPPPPPQAPARAPPRVRRFDPAPRQPRLFCQTQKLPRPSRLEAWQTAGLDSTGSTYVPRDAAEVRRGPAPSLCPGVSATGEVSVTLPGQTEFQV